MAGVSNTFNVGAADTQGQRQNQEDHYILADADGSHRPFNEIEVLVAAVSDGVGGEAAGEVASQLAVVNFSRAVQAYKGRSHAEALEDGLLSANSAIREAVEANPEYNGMACTLTGACLTPSSLYWVSVGDSHLYLVREHNLVKLNDDHSLGAALDRDAHAGKISSEEAASTPGRNMLMSYLAGEPLREIDLTRKPVKLKAGDRLILATDGLNTLDDQQIIEVCDRFVDAQQCAEGLISAVTAAKRPNQDNTMVVVVDPGGKSMESRPATASRLRMFLLALFVSLLIAVLVSVMI